MCLFAGDGSTKICASCGIENCAECNNGDGVCYICANGYFRVALDPPDNSDVVCLTGLSMWIPGGCHGNKQGKCREHLHKS